MGLREFANVPPDPRDWGRWMRAQFITADSVAPNTITTGMIVDAAVTFAKFQNLNALSVFGRSVNSAGVGANISAANDGEIMRRSGASIGFGTILSSSVSDFNEAAQDAVGAALTDTATINVTYTDGTNSITFDVLPGGVDHNALLNYVSDQHVGHSSVTLTAGAGLTGGGDISASRTFDVGAGTGITVNANDVAVNQAFAPTWTDTHIFAAQVRFTGVNTPSIVNANTNDWAATTGAYTKVRFSVDNNGRLVTGAASGAAGREVTFYNISSASAIFTHNDSSSTAGNRFLNIGNQDQRVEPGASITYWYDGTSSAWRQQVTVTNFARQDPAQFTANQNNFALSNTTQRLYVDTDASRDFTGMTGGADGRTVYIYNDGATNALVIKHESASSTAANRFSLPSGTDSTLAAGGGAIFQYDGTASRWRQASRIA